MRGGPGISGFRFVEDETALRRCNPAARVHYHGAGDHCECGATTNVREASLMRGGRLSTSERTRLVGLFRKELASLVDPPPLGPDAHANLMINTTPAVARKWLEDEGLLDEQLGDREVQV